MSCISSNFILKWDCLWQRPREEISNDHPCWYCKAPVGKNTLGKLTKMFNISQYYANHNIRATAVTLFDEASFEARHIMKVSTHKSEASIRSNAHRLPEQKKREMSAT